MKHLFIIIISLFSGMWCYAQNGYPQRQYNQYQETTDFELVDRVLRTKQNQYDINFKKVSDKTERINKLINRLLEKRNKKFSENEIKYFMSYYKFIDNITKEELTSNSTTESILKTLEGVEDYLYKLLYP